MKPLEIEMFKKVSLRDESAEEQRSEKKADEEEEDEDGDHGPLFLKIMENRKQSFYKRQGVQGQLIQ